MKIIFTDIGSNPYKPGDGGTSNTIWNMAKSAMELGNEVIIIAPYLSNIYPFSNVPVQQFPIPRWFRRNIFGAIISYFYFTRTINRYCSGFDLIHTRDYLSGYIFSLFCKQPIVITVAGNPYERKSKKVPAFDPITTAIYLLACKLSAREKKCFFIATSSDMEKWWQISGVDKSRLKLIPLGVDTTLFSYRKACKTELEWNEGQFHLLYVGRLIPKLKGLEELINAVSLLRNEMNIHLHIVGNGALEKDLRMQVDQLGISSMVTFYGWVEQKELPKYYSAADLSILPSFSEGFGRTILESMSCGTAVLGTHVGGMADLIKEGYTGFLLDEISASSITKKIASVNSNKQLLQQVAVQSRANVLEKFGWDKIMRQVMVDVYLPVINLFK